MALTTVDQGLLSTNAQYTGFKNRFINPQMVIDQRNNGASQTINNTTAYTVDRWYVGFVGGSGTSQRVSGTGGFQNAIRMTGGSGVTTAFVGQKIESFNSADLAGNTVTVSFRASSSTLTSMTWNARFPNAVDNYSGVTSISSGSITLTSTSTNYTFSFACPSGVTNGLEIFFLTGSFTSGTLDITGVQLEKGSTATSFDYRPYGTELALCQRYFYSLGGTAYEVFGFGAWRNSTTASIYIKHSVPMRVQPTLNVLNLASTWLVASGINTPTSANIDQNDLNATMIDLGGVTQSYSNFARWISGNSTATRVQLSSEL